jgi:hypothetical protein
MKRLLGFVAATTIAMLSALPGAALASSIAFTEAAGPGLHLCLSASAPAACNTSAADSIGASEFTLDITDDGFVAGSPITAAELTLTLADDGGPADGSEKFDLFLDGTLVHHNANANHDVVITFSNFTSLADGELVVTLSATSGDFFLEGVRLTGLAEPSAGTQGEGPADPGAAAVPAPAALFMLAAGLAGVAWRRRAAR